MLVIPNKFIIFVQTNLFCLMKMYTRAFNQMKELNAFVNENKIPKENIVSVLQSNDGTYLLVYYAEQ